MQSANTIMILKHKFTCLLLAALPLFCFAQENSPYSRYGIGNIVPQGNIANRAMGGISAAIVDFTSASSVNPASMATLLYTTVDIGLEYDGRTIRSKNPVGSYQSNNGIISYLQVGIPLLNGNKKAFDNKVSWSMTFGLKPISKINYKIGSLTANPIDSISTLYEGNGGINQGFIGTAVKIKGLSFGFNTGYLFGQKDYTTKLALLNDSVSYQKAKYETKSNFGGMFLNAGVQYAAKIKGGFFRLGAYGTLSKNYNATKDETRQTFNIDASGADIRIDSVSAIVGQKGKIQLPSTYGFGFAVEKEHVLFGADFETSQWQNYRYFGKEDLVKNSWTAKAGVQIYPASVGATGYFNFVKYRAGFAYGSDYIRVDNDLPVYTISVGGAFPLKLRHNFYDYQYSTMNVTFEYGSRGNNNNNITENTYKVSLGFSLSDMNWFRRQKYQ
ncbi:MAG: hypothetical protein ABI266_07725 [Ginsengibacter sp.]